MHNIAIFSVYLISLDKDLKTLNNIEDEEGVSEMFSEIWILGRLAKEI